MKLENRTPENTEGVAKETLQRTKSEFGMIPNMYAQMANNGSLLDSYKYAYDSFRKNAGFTSEEQEVIFLSISYANGCEYCMAAHSTVANLNQLDTDLILALREGNKLRDTKLESLRKFTILLVEKRGIPAATEIHEFINSGYHEKDIIGIITAIGVKVFSNYFNHIFTPNLDEVFSKMTWKSKKSNS